MLPQKPAARGRKLLLRRLVTWSGLPVLGVLTTFGLLPQAGTDATRIVEQDISLPYIAYSGSATTFWRNDQVLTDDTAEALLRRLDVNDAAAARYLHISRATLSFRKLAAGTNVQAETDSDGRLLALRYMSGNGDQTLVERDGANFATRILPAQVEHHLFVRTGSVSSTLFAATDAAGLPEAATTQLTDIFGGDIDFQHDLKQGDTFTVIYQMDYSNGEPLHVGHIVAAEFINRGEMHRALYFQPGNGHGDYYTPDGRSLHRTFLRSPVEYSRISSGYTSARFHPILHKWRAHRGIDFAAPMGARVRATAAGTVEFAGRQRGYGNLVIIRHEGRYSTAYGHLLHFVHNLLPGQHVTQGQVIGYVGMSGWATGPHLHYEFRVDGHPRNPLRIMESNVAPIDTALMPAFLTATRDLSARLSSLHNTAFPQPNQS